jgi:hypothetical protein
MRTVEHPREGARKDFSLWLFSAFCFLISPLTAYASSGSEGASFLNIPVGAGPAALGSAYSALAANAYAPVYNPAGLGFVDEAEVAGQHLSYLESTHDEFLSFVKPLPKTFGSENYRSVGVSAQYFGSGDMTQTDLNDSHIGTFSSHYGSYTLSYGQLLNPRLSLGISGKWINAAIADVSANAFAADLGAMYHPVGKWSLAATVTNIGSKLTFLDQGDSLPMAFHLGAAYQPRPQWIISTEGVYEPSGLASFHIGGEWHPIDLIAIRAGYRTDTLQGLSPMAGLTAGLALTLWGQEFAYAYLPYGDLGMTQYFSLLIRFGDRNRAAYNLVHLPKEPIPTDQQALANLDYKDPGLLQLLTDNGEAETNALAPLRVEQQP